MMKALKRLQHSLAWRFFPAADLHSRTGTGLRLRLTDKGDWASAAEMFIERTYDPFFQHLGAVRRWVDVGCNAGFFSLGLLEHLRSQSGDAPVTTEAVLFDASARSVAKTDALIAENELRGVWRTRVCVIGPAGQEVEFCDFKYSVASTIFPKGRPERVIRMKTTPLAEAIGAPPQAFDLLKVDIEGAEKCLFEQESGVLREFALVLMEWHAPEWTGAQLRQWLEQAGAELLAVRSLPCEWDPARQGHSFDSPIGLALWRRSRAGAPGFSLANSALKTPRAGSPEGVACGQRSGDR